MKTGDLIKYIGSSRHDLTRNKTYSIYKVYTDESLITVIDDAGDRNDITKSNYCLINSSVEILKII
jgi:hypothetical protein